MTKYENGGFDEIGAANTYPPLDAIRNFQANPALKSQFVNIPGARTTWVGFNFTTGPFAPAGGNIDDPIALAGRRAFSEAIDRNALVNVACGPGGITCKPATGGVISKGLQAYLGDNQDPNVVFNPTKAKADLATWDPNRDQAAGPRVLVQHQHDQLGDREQPAVPVADQPRRARRHPEHGLPDVPDQPPGQEVHPVP